MLLLSSSAQHIYWLGRYLFRIEYMASHLPFCDDEQAADFAQALCLHIDDAENLNNFMLDHQQPYSLLSQLEIARDNMQALRGLLSSETYAELTHLIKNVVSDVPTIQNIVKECCAILKTEREDIALFFHSFSKLQILIIYTRLATRNMTYLLTPIRCYDCKNHKNND